MLTRREMLSTVALGTLAAAVPQLRAQTPAEFRLKYILASSLYGYTNLAEILPEVAKVGAKTLDIWPKVHGNQREQLDELGEARFAELLKQHDVTLGCITQFKLGPFNLADEMRLAQRLSCRLIVTGGAGPAGLSGDDLRKAVAAFIERLKPQLAVAEETDMTIAIENHAHNLFDSGDSLKWLAELRPTKRLQIAFAPYHLPQDEKLLAKLIRELGDATALFYAWQHGQGSAKQAKELELEQLPGRGKLDFAPLLQALRDIRFAGWTEIFMHPFPRGIPILETTPAVTEELNRARASLERSLSTL